MSQQVQQELDQFKKLITNSQKNFDVKEICEFGYVLEARHFLDRKDSDVTRPITFSVFGVVHGNEVVGIAVLNQLLRFLNCYPEQLTFPLALALGNPKAALADQRFLDQDLNRSFGAERQHNYESKRAKELASILRQTQYFLDLHQTKQPSELPFFIFPYTKLGFQLARHIAPSLPIVTHWHDSYSKDGLCSDEYTIKQGGVGITIELGQNGFGPYQVFSGVYAVLSALKAISCYLAPKELDCFEYTANSEIYTWSEIIYYPESGDAELLTGFKNFQLIERGQQLGVYENKPFYAKQTSKILFPHYPDTAREAKPGELCRLMKRIEPKDLPSQQT